MNARMWIASVVALVVASHSCSAARPDAHGALAGIDTLLHATEYYRLTVEELEQYNIHTIEDILELIPGIAWWREGPPGSRGGYSIEGRSGDGVILLLGGEPFHDPVTLEPLSRFLPLSRLKAIEVYYGGSPFIAGGTSSNVVVNIIVGEGGAPGPMSQVEFTYGGGNRRARRVWFASPKGRLSAAVAYDEYLQDAVEALVELPNRKLGDYDSRSVLFDLVLAPDSLQSILVRFHRFEDTYVGTFLSSVEDIRYDGFDSNLRYRRGGLTVSLQQRTLEQKRRAGRLSGFVTSGAVRYRGRAGGLEVRCYCTGERAHFGNRIWGIPFDPSLHRFEGGIAVGGTGPASLAWRGGLVGGLHSESGGYTGGEIGVSINLAGWFSPHISLARRMRLPSALELFQPVTDMTLGGEEYSISGNPGLEPEVTEEAALGVSISSFLSARLFVRRERSRIILSGSGPAVYSAEGEADVAGGRCNLWKNGRLLGFEYGLDLGVEIYGERSEFTPGIPEYRILGNFSLSRRLFKNTETAALRIHSEAVGERSWEGIALDPYQVVHVAASLTVMSARLQFQVKNLIAAQYETIPGFLMPERHFRLGIHWALFD